MAIPGNFNFNDFYTRNYRRTYLFAKSYVHNSFVAEDIASEALISLWEIMKANDIRHPVTFLFSIVKNKAIDHLRHELVEQEAFSRMSDLRIRELNTRISTLEACDPEKLFSAEIKAIMDSALAELPERTQQVFKMSRFKNQSREEIAQVLGISIKGVEYHMARVLSILRVKLKDYLPFFLLLLFNLGIIFPETY